MEMAAAGAAPGTTAGLGLRFVILQNHDFAACSFELDPELRQDATCQAILRPVIPT